MKFRVFWYVSIPAVHALIPDQLRMYHHSYISQLMSRRFKSCVKKARFAHANFFIPVSSCERMHILISPWLWRMAAGVKEIKRSFSCQNQIAKHMLYCIRPYHLYERMPLADVDVSPILVDPSVMQSHLISNIFHCNQRLIASCLTIFIFHSRDFFYLQKPAMFLTNL